MTPNRRARSLCKRAGLEVKDGRWCYQGREIATTLKAAMFELADPAEHWPADIRREAQELCFLVGAARSSAGRG
jgi:hypothetical protein